jgi:hypothetical protein
MKKFIFYSTLFSIFTEILLINVGFDFKFFYLIVFINLFILALFGKVKYTKNLLRFHFLILFSGLFSCIFGYNHFSYFFIQFFFLLIIPIYYYSYYIFFEDKIDKIISSYCKACFILAIIGFVKLPYDISLGKSLSSLMQEPAHYCAIVLPAYFISLKDKSYPRYYFIVILLSIIISGSSLGFIALGLSLILMIKRISVIKSIMSLICAICLGSLVYVAFTPFRLRVDDTVKSLTSGDLSEANLSTYALLSNLYVAVKSFSSNPILGNGIGSHIYSRDLYLGKIEGVEVFENMGMEDLNAQDGGSLFIRLTSELGLLGLVGVFLFIFKFYVKNSDGNFTIHSIVSKAILLYFFSKLFREGHYFSPEMYFFVFLYVFNKYDSKLNMKLEKKNIIAISI